MNDISLALLMAIPLTIVLSFIQIMFDTKVPIVSYCITASFFLYQVVMITGIIITTFMASAIIGNKFPGPPFIWYAFIGVFGFEALIQKINVTIFDKGVLSINDWITMAKTSAVSASLKKSTEKDIFLKQQLADQLMAKFAGNPGQVRVIATNYLGVEACKKLIDAFGDTANTEAHLAYVLANEKPIQVKAILASKL